MTSEEIFEYQFAALSGFDYNYDPSQGQPLSHSFDPYANAYDDQAISNTSGVRRSKRESESALVESSQTTPAMVGVGASNPSRSPRPPSPGISRPITPSPEYLRQAEVASEYVVDPSSSRKLLVLDLNGTLVYRSPHRRDGRNRYSRRSRPSYQRYQAEYDPYSDPTVLRPLRPAHPRPYVASFAEYLFHPRTKEWLDTMVWSSAQPHSVEDMVDRCFGNRRDELVAVWARDTLGLEERDYHRKVQTTKDLARPWAALSLLNQASSSSSSKLPHAHSALTTLLLDDSPLKAQLQPWNHLCIREYSAELRNADLEAYDIEYRLEQIKVKGAFIEEIRAIEEGTSVSDGIAESFATELHVVEVQGEDRGAAVGTNDDSQSDIRKRKRLIKKQRKKMQSLTRKKSRALDGSRTYDQTLLAVIGILDHIRHESNVAGWVRNGGLLLDGASSGHLHPDDSGTSGSSSESNSSTVDAGASKRLKFSPSAYGDEEQDTLLSDSPANIVDTAAINVAMSNWFNNPLALRHWVHRGLRALDRLGVDAVAGIRR